MSDKELVESLKKQAPTVPALNDVLLMFSTRERARGIITLNALADRMKIEKFQHGKDEYATVLRILAQHGVGTLDTDVKGRVKALKGVKISIPTLGRAVVSEGQLKRYNKRNHYYKPAPVMQQVKAHAPAAVPAPAPTRPVVPTSQIASLPAAMNLAVVYTSETGAKFNIQVSKGTSAEDIARLFDKLQDAPRGKELSQ